MKKILSYDGSFVCLGTPGTGKTVVATYLYQDLVQQSCNVLYLCYNVLLAELLGKGAVRTADSWYGSVKSAIQGNVEGGYLKTMLADEYDAVKLLFEQWVEQQGQYDVVIIDEGQDLPPSFYSLLNILTGRVAIFMDDNQQLEGETSSVEEVYEYFPSIVDFQLTRNFRNTKEIYSQARQFVRNDLMAQNKHLLSLCPSSPSSAPEQLRQQSHGDWYVFIEKTIKENSGKTIGVFFPSDSKHTNLLYDFSQQLFAENIQHTPYSGGSNRSGYRKNIKENGLSNILLTTYLCSKGMEFDIVILLVTKSVGDSDYINNILYVLCTRAKEKLYIAFDY